MAMPTDVPVIDSFIGLPFEFDYNDPKNFHDEIKYMFKDLPPQVKTNDSIGDLLRLMDKYNIERGLMPVHYGDEMEERAVLQHPDRLVGAFDMDPNAGMTSVRQMQDAYERLGIVAAQWMPSGSKPPIPINHKNVYPLYAKAVELDIPVFVNGGVPGPLVPFDTQYPGHVDEVCLHFPELKFVFRHCCEPWVDLTIKLLMKYPNLYYSTSGFAPKWYPKEIIQYANTRGSDKILYGGYYPYGLDLARIFKDMPELELRDEVWPKFLRGNAERILKLDSR
jgi:predicted TIM-barrel fold metal-dependent hydrolase